MRRRRLWQGPAGGALQCNAEIFPALFVFQITDETMEPDTEDRARMRAGRTISSFSLIFCSTPVPPLGGPTGEPNIAAPPSPP